jgi:hypothetical protein
VTRHRYATTMQRRSERPTSPGLPLLCALLIGGLGAGCERNTAPTEPEAGDVVRTTPVESPVAAQDTSSQPAAPAQGEEPDAAPLPAGSDAPSPTIGKSSSDATRKDGTSILRDVRTGVHPGADRVAFEFEGAGLPAWEVEYVDRPVRDCGTGDAVPVAGDAWLEIRFVGAQAHTDAGESTSGPRRRTVNQPVMLELVRTCDFEGHVTWVVGVASPNAYTPQVMAAPSRLVIDIAH